MVLQVNGIVGEWLPRRTKRRWKTRANSARYTTTSRDRTCISSQGSSKIIEYLEINCVSEIGHHPSRISQEPQVGLIESALYRDWRVRIEIASYEDCKLNKVHRAKDLLLISCVTSKLFMIVFLTHVYWSEFLVVGCLSSHQPTQIREDLEYGNLEYGEDLEDLKYGNLPNGWI